MTRSAGSGKETTLTDIVHGLFPQESSAPLHFQPRTYVFHQGTDVEAVFLLTRGSLVLERIDEDGRMAMFGLQKAGGTLLAWQDLLDGAVHRNSGQTLTACDLVVVTRDKFETALRENEGLLLALMRQAASQANSYEEHIFRLSTLDVPERLYWTLFSLAGSPEDNESVEVNTPLMKRDLAALVGTSPETISRSLRRLEKMKVAEFTKKNTFRIMPPKRD